MINDRFICNIQVIVELKNNEEIKEEIIRQWTVMMAAISEREEGKASQVILEQRSGQNVGGGRGARHMAIGEDYSR